MRTSRTLIAIGTTAFIVAIVAAVSISALRHWPRDIPTIDPRLVIEATTRFAQDCREKGRQLPPTIPLGELVAGGFLRPDLTNGFPGMDVTIYTDASEETPQNILMLARFADGTGHVLLGDGSVQQVTPARLREALRDAAETGQKVGPR